MTTRLTLHFHLSFSNGHGRQDDGRPVRVALAYCLGADPRRRRWMWNEESLDEILHANDDVSEGSGTSTSRWPWARSALDSCIT